jgi:predicted GIY-YIG superfamily endonuclease
MSTELDSTPTVYLLIGADGAPIYVGATQAVKQRLAAHRRDKTEYDALGGRTKREATQRVDLVRCTDTDEMRATELRLIKEHRPVLNIADKPGDERYRQFAAEALECAPPLSQSQRDELAEKLKPLRKSLREKKTDVGAQTMPRQKGRRPAQQVGRSSDNDIHHDRHRTEGAPPTAAEGKAGRVSW